MSFSEQKDDLSQWRAYGGANGENGYCIGFDRDKLTNLGPLIKVSYVGLSSLASNDDLYVEKQVRHLFNEIIDLGKQGCINVLGSTTSYPAGFGETPEQFVGNFFGGYLQRLFPLIKHGAFYSECECRIVHGFVKGEENELEFLQKSHMMTRHLPMGLKKGSTRLLSGSISQDEHKFFPLPIREIMVGPARYQDVSMHSVEAMLVKHKHKSYKYDETGYDWDQVEVTRSQTPVQSV